MLDRLQRLINLINKTGDKLIVFDQVNKEQCFVISSLEDYEKLFPEKPQAGKQNINLTQDELIDKINRDIALWKNSQVFETSDGSTNWPKEKEIKEIETVDIDENKIFDSSPYFKKKNKNNYWSIPKDRKQKAAEIIEETSN